MVAGAIAELAASEEGVLQTAFTATPQGKRLCLPRPPPNATRLEVVVLAGQDMNDPALNNILVSLHRLGYVGVRIVAGDQNTARREAATMLKELGERPTILIPSRDVLFLKPPEIVLKRMEKVKSGVLVADCGTDLDCTSLPPLAGEAVKIAEILDLLKESNPQLSWNVTLGSKNLQLVSGGDLFRTVSRTRLANPSALVDGPAGAAHFPRLSTPHVVGGTPPRNFDSFLANYEATVDAFSRTLPKPSLPRIVISLTSIPPRLPGLRLTLSTLLNQTLKPDAIYLNLPKISKRFAGKGAPELPQFIEEISVVVNQMNIDYGPATKLIGALDVESDPETLIVTADDDMGYPSNFVEDLVTRFLGASGTAAVGYAGQVIDLVDGHARVKTAASIYASTAGVDIIEAFRGAVYKREWFDDSIREIPEVCFRNSKSQAGAEIVRRSLDDQERCCRGAAV